MIKIYKLKYTDKETAIADLKAKGVYMETEEGLHYEQGTHAVVEIGNVVDQEATYDEQGNMLTEPTYVDGYHFDIMIDTEIDFGENEIIPKHPRHTFAGY